MYLRRVLNAGCVFFISSATRMLKPGHTSYEMGLRSSENQMVILKLRDQHRVKNAKFSIRNSPFQTKGFMSGFFCQSMGTFGNPWVADHLVMGHEWVHEYGLHHHQAPKALIP